MADENPALAIALLTAALRRAVSGELPPAVARVALDAAAQAAPRASARSLDEWPREAGELAEALSWRAFSSKKKRPRFKKPSAPLSRVPAPTTLPGTNIEVELTRADLAHLDCAPDGLYWLAREQCAAARIGGVTLIGNLCVVGRGRSQECYSVECTRELRGCPRFHDPVRFPGSLDARALPLPRALRRVAGFSWAPSREKLDAVLAAVTPEACSEIEAAAMHLVLVAVAAKRELLLVSRAPPLPAPVEAGCV